MQRAIIEHFRKIGSPISRGRSRGLLSPTWLTIVGISCPWGNWRDTGLPGYVDRAAVTRRDRGLVHVAIDGTRRIIRVLCGDRHISYAWFCSMNDICNCYVFSAHTHTHILHTYTHSQHTHIHTHAHTCTHTHAYAYTHTPRHTHRPHTYTYTNTLIIPWSSSGSALVVLEALDP